MMSDKILFFDTYYLDEVVREGLQSTEGKVHRSCKPGQISSTVKNGYEWRGSEW